MVYRLVEISKKIKRYFTRTVCTTTKLKNSFLLVGC